ncbi:GtrA family protein [Sporolactobacillus shoreicorticis]|uniref:GtrA family protein n=1 Tax=Sporolactobacillus shoreicorticis TaxID=1923877 RepID=A0ABW5S6S1_9BACL|nr:GtrA family protein [Sporolactobacillus shoreicorticis]MCO7126221.1 GtrA family protein [Sporolactobacillus shoreicorticis]
MSTQNSDQYMSQKIKKENIKWKWIKQGFVFGAVGVSNTAVDFIVFLLLTHFFSIFYAAAQILSYGAGMLNSYVWNSRITFSASERSLSRLIRFIVLNLAVLGITLLAMRSMLFLPLYINKLISTFIGLSVNFLLSKLWVFKA